MSLLLGSGAIRTRKVGGKNRREASARLAASCRQRIDYVAGSNLPPLRRSVLGSHRISVSAATSHGSGSLPRCLGGINRATSSVASSGREEESDGAKYVQPGLGVCQGAKT